jgi:propanediol dehydratase small subunit
MNAPAPARVAAVRADLLRDFIEALEPVEHDSAAARHCLSNADDVGARYHLKRVVECVKAAAATFRELEALTSDHSAASERAA